MLPPTTIFSKFDLNESNLKIIILSAFAMYFLILYEMYPFLIFGGQNILFTLILPLVVVIIGLNRKKIPLKSFSLKNNSMSKKNVDTNSIENLISDSSDESINSVVSDSDPSGDSEIESLLAGISSDKETGENSEIESLLAGTDSTMSEIDQNSLDDTDTNLLIMEKMEPLENDIQTIKTDFDQFKQDLTVVKEELDILSTSFETTLTDIKSLVTDLNNPLNFMKDDSFKKNIQTINVDELIKDPTSPIHKSEPVHETTEPVHETTEPVHETAEPVHETAEPVHETAEPVHETAEPVHETAEPVHETAEPTEYESLNLPEEVITLVDELSKDFVPEQVFELTKIHCKTTKLELDEKQLIFLIDKKNNSDVLTKKFSKSESELSSEYSQLQTVSMGS
ncbi:hypothetical protein C5F50_07145 [Nitrosopumilus ureiphilus]|uniref:Uncharacterized protein n=2 Tax=Nitrosopumilus ureiphilus TaxID=1470067 RepID=A0A7D5M4B7_9ARCH|nr:hypothetical protein C5F50_07145 [Nitrosopumilus ureiphilus]